MKIYRLSKKRYANDLSGTGAKLNGGRWNSRGKFALYTAENVSLAKLEVAVHMDLDLIPDDYYLTEIELPDTSKIKNIALKNLPKDWDSIPHSESVQLIGDAFLNQNENLALKVPSAIVHQEHNIIVNPNHQDFSKVKIARIERFTFDDRLFRR